MKCDGVATICDEVILIDSSGGTGIRTLERVTSSPVFKTGAFNRSAIPPMGRLYHVGASLAIGLRGSILRFCETGLLRSVDLGYSVWLK